MKRNVHLTTLGIIALFISASFCCAQTPPVRWVQQAISTNSLSGSGVTLDGFGNSYVVGSLYKTARFGVVTLDSGAGVNLSLVKYDSAGKPLWAVKAGGTNSNSSTSAKSVASDGLGNVYIAGNFTGEAAFGDFRITNSIGPAPGFVAKVEMDPKIKTRG